MGNGASFTPQQGAAISAHIRERYETYKKEIPALDDVAIQDNLTRDYKAFVLTQVHFQASDKSEKTDRLVRRSRSNSKESISSHAPHYAAPKGTSVVRKSFDKSESSSPTKTSNRQISTNMSRSSNNSGKLMPMHAARRRSYGQLQGTSTNVNQGKDAKSPVSRSEKPIEKADEVIEEKAEEVPADSWESVSSQPFCTICLMAFKNAAFLQRHIKYSDLHKRAVDRINNPHLVEDKELDKEAEVQVEGIDFRILYSGSKLYWRSNETIELTFVHHLKIHVLEIIGFDFSTSRELNRLYLDYIITSNVAEKEAKRHPEKSGDLSHSGSMVGLSNESDINQSASTKNPEISSRDIFEKMNNHQKLLDLVRFMVERVSLVITPGAEDGKEISKNISFDKVPNELYPVQPQLDHAPHSLVPTAVVHKRRTSFAEIDAKLDGLSKETQLLSAATSRAEAISDLVHMGAAELAKNIAYRDFNPNRKRWLWAIRRIIRERKVNHTREVLNAKNITYVTKKQYGQTSMLVTVN
eukprot:gene6576-9041_t